MVVVSVDMLYVVEELDGEIEGGGGRRRQRKNIYRGKFSRVPARLNLDDEAAISNKTKKKKKTKKNFWLPLKKKN